MAIPLPGYESPIRRTLGTYNQLDSLVNNYLQGIENKKKNELFRQQAEMEIAQSKAAEDRKNQLFPLELEKYKMQNELYKPLTQADISNKIAQTNRLNFQQQNPLYGQPGIAGQLGAAELIRQNPQLASDPNAVNMIMQSIQQNQASKQAETELNQKRASGYTFNSLPLNDRSYLLAQAAGMGIQPNEAAKMFNQGKTVNDMALEQGFDPNNLPDPIYPLTPTGQTQLKQRQAALSEMKILSKTISDWSAPYSRKIMGFSPSQVKDALTGKNKEQQAKFLAARILAPEQAAIRFRSMGGNVGITAIEEMTDKAMLNGKIFESLVSPSVYSRANDLVEDAINRTVEAANKSVLQTVASKKSSEKQNNVMTYNPATGRLE